MPEPLKKKGLTLTRALFLCEPDVVTYLRQTLRYPDVQQAGVLKKTNSKTGTVEIWYLLTSCSREALPPDAFLAAIRKHWQIENGLHHVKDRTLKEDAHYTTFPQGGCCLAILRNAVVSILNQITPPRRRKVSRPIELLGYCAHPKKALTLLHAI